MTLLRSGNFYVCPALANGDRDVGAEIILFPNPTYVEYGDRLRFEIVESEARAIKQFSDTNPREKKWVWVNYRIHVPRYESQYQTLFSMQEHVRVEIASGSPYVYLKETVTDMLGVHNSSGTLTTDWVRCRILYVDRSVARQGGNAVYPETVMSFTIDDPNYKVY